MPTPRSTAPSKTPSSNSTEAVTQRNWSAGCLTPQPFQHLRLGGRWAVLRRQPLVPLKGLPVRPLRAVGVPAGRSQVSEQLQPGSQVPQDIPALAVLGQPLPVQV